MIWYSCFRFWAGQNTFGCDIVRKWATETLIHLLANVLIHAARARWLQHVKYKPHAWSDARGWLQTRSREKLPLHTASSPDLFRSALNDFMCVGSRLRGEQVFRNVILEVQASLLLLKFIKILNVIFCQKKKRI